MNKRLLFLVPIVSIGFGIFASAASAEESPGSALFRMPHALTDPLSRTRSMYEAVHQNAFVRSLMSSDKMNALSASAHVITESVETTRFQHYFHGLEVVGSETRFHSYPSDLAEVNADDLARFDLDTSPTITLAQATAIAQSLTSARHQLTGAPELKILPQMNEGSARLVFWLTLSSGALDDAREVVLDAHTGEVLANVGKHIELAQVNVFDTKEKTIPFQIQIKDGKQVVVAPAGSKPDQACQLVNMTPGPGQGAPAKITLANCAHVVTSSTPSTAADASARRAASNSTKVLSYYQTVHGRNSYDGQGTQIQSLVHAGIQYDNAFWREDLKVMAYGDGDGKEWGDMTQALDVAGHEITHAVVSSTAKLVSFNEAGALNESYADFFGLMIAGNPDWVMGKSVFINKAAATGIRNLANPHALQSKYTDSSGKKIPRTYPASMSEIQKPIGPCDEKNDRCYVHLNSTIPSHAAYLVAQAIGRDSTQKLYYAVLANDLAANDGFAKAAAKTKARCVKMYSGDVCAKVTSAFASVGL